MNVFFGGVPDQYYAMTSRLTARGYQQTPMRVAAGCILILGVAPALAALDPASSPWRYGSLAFGVIAFACVGMAMPWLGYRWPSRAQSTTVVVVAAVFLTVGCNLARDPLAGLLIATSFVFALGYAALFHGSRLQLLVALTSAATVLTLMVRIAMNNIATALAVGVPVVMLNIVVGLGCRTIAEVIAADGVRTDVEPLTGLLSREGFDEQAASLLGARNRSTDRYLVVAVLALDGFAALHSLRGGRGTERARVAVGQALRETVRRNALLGHFGESEFIVADTFTQPDPTPLAERLRGAVAATPPGLTASIGVVCKPLRLQTGSPPHDVIDAAIAQATTVMHRASRGGGNRADYLIEEDGQ
ncbi:MAG: diguanylate cyclase [Mycobacterium sp.]